MTFLPLWLCMIPLGLGLPLAILDMWDVATDGFWETDHSRL